MTYAEQVAAIADRVFVKSCEAMTDIPDGVVHTCVTSPPYLGLRDYKIDGQIGLEATLDEWIARLVGVFREVRRVLRDDGTLWVNLGDAWANKPKGPGGDDKSTLSPSGVSYQRDAARNAPHRGGGVKIKDLLGQPWAVAFALRADGWYLRDAIIWCLAPSTRVYARTARSEGPATLHDLVRLDPTTVELWNGDRWTRVLGWGPTRCDEPLRLVLRSGERIGTTPNHEWPLADGRIVRADALAIGDVLASTRLPEPVGERAAEISEDLAWFAGLYLAEGSRSDDAIQLAGHEDETERMDRVAAIAERYGGSAVVHLTLGHGVSQVVHGPMLDGAIRTFVAGRVSKDKHLHPRAWSYPNRLLRAFLDGYLVGDGHRDVANDRWRIGFTKNDLWAADLRTLAARLGATLTLNPSLAKMGRARVFEAYHGEIRFDRSGHGNERYRAEVVAIERGIPGTFWDVAVEDEPHLFALASGVLTHNCKPNPMPSSVTDRCTPAYEFIFMLAKSKRYFADMDAVRTPLSDASLARISQTTFDLQAGRPKDYANGTNPSQSARRALENLAKRKPAGWDTRSGAHGVDAFGRYSQFRIERDNPSLSSPPPPPQVGEGFEFHPLGANLRNVWTIPTQPYPGEHFATFPVELPTRCIKIGTSEAGCCAECGAPLRRLVDVAYDAVGRTTNGPRSTENRQITAGFDQRLEKRVATAGFERACDHDAPTVPCLVLDPFLGSGTTGEAATLIGRRWVGYELNSDYAALAERRPAIAERRAYETAIRETSG